MRICTKRKFLEQIRTRISTKRKFLEQIRTRISTKRKFLAQKRTRIGVKSILEHKNACGKVSTKCLPILSIIDP